MAHAKFAGIKPHVNIGVIGPVSHGKTTLTAAITMTLASVGEPVEKEDDTAHVEYETPQRQYTHVDYPGNIDDARNMMTGEAQMDGAILLVSAADDEAAVPQIREHISLAAQVGVPQIVVFLNREDQVDNPEVLELNELVVRNLLSSYDFNGDDIIIVTGSALKAVEKLTVDPKTQRGQYEWVDKIWDLINAIDGYIPTPA